MAGRAAVKPERSDALDPYLPGSGDDGHATEHYDLTLTYRPASNRLDGYAQITATARRRLDQVTLDLSGLTVSKVAVDGRRPKKYLQRKGKLVITPALPLAAGQQFVVAVNYSGNPKPVRSRWGDVGWEELTEGALVAGQPNGAPSWFPCNDHPGDKAAYRISVTTDAPFTVVANGVLVSRRAHASTRTWVYEQAEPMASYLATVQIGHYELRTLSDDDPPQRVARPARLDRAVRADFSRQHLMMRCFTNRFGPYPFASYTVVVTGDPLEIPLEAQGMSVFGANHVDGERTHERLVAHELAHQWFGNSLTPSRWQDIWLNEGFACYAEWLWSDEAGGPSAEVLAERYWKRLRNLPQDLVLADPGPELMFDDRVYKRGALALHALRRTLGDGDFFALLQGWVAAHRHGLVSTAAFREHVEATAGTPARELLDEWLFPTAVPKLPDRPADGRRPT
jgi:aminopeptidase N